MQEKSERQSELTYSTEFVDNHCTQLGNCIGDSPARQQRFKLMHCKLLVVVCIALMLAFVMGSHESSTRDETSKQLTFSYELNLKSSVGPPKTKISPETMFLAKSYKKLLFQQPSESLIRYQKQYYQKQYRINDYQKEIPICVVVPSYQNARNDRYILNLNSILRQQYNNYKIIYIDDASPDGTGKKVQEFMKNKGISKDRMTLIINKVNMKAMFSLRRAAVQFCRPESVYVGLDGDDLLIGTQVFKLLNAAYQSKDLWFVYTNFFFYNQEKVGFCAPMDQEWIRTNTYRDQAEKGNWFTSHLRSFYTKLFQLLPDSQFMYDNGGFFTAAYDRAITYPIQELAAQRQKYIPQLTHQYIVDKEYSEQFAHAFEQKQVGPILLKRSKQQRRQCLFYAKDGQCIPANQLINRMDQYQEKQINFPMPWNFQRPEQQSILKQIDPNTQEQNNQVAFFCVVSIAEKNNTDFWSSHFKSLFEIDYNSWQGFYYTSQPNLLKDWIKKNYNERVEKITVLETSGNRGRDHYDALQNRCAWHSVAVLIRDDQVFVNGSSIFQQINRQIRVQPPSYLWVYNYLDLNGNLGPWIDKDLYYFRRIHYFPDLYQKQGQTWVEKYKLRENNFNRYVDQFRIFKRQFYSHISYFDLTYQNETFYESELAFIFPLTEMRSNERIDVPKIPEWNISYPGTITLHKDTALFRKLSAKSVIRSESQMEEIMGIAFSRQYNSITESINKFDTDYNKVYPWREQSKFNALERTSPNQEPKIPQKIHQIWLGTYRDGVLNTTIPSYKQKFMDSMRRVYPKYQYLLWTTQNITQENFPTTYKYLQQLLQAHKLKNAIDLIELEILYRHGGFYFDTNYEAFRSIDHFRKYDLVISVYQSPLWAMHLMNSFLGSTKQNKYIGRLLKEDLLSSIDLKAQHPLTDSYLLGKAFEGRDYMDVKFVPAALISPYLMPSKDKRFENMRCVVNQIPRELERTQVQIIQADRKKIIYPCKGRYPRAYGVNHSYLD